MFIRTNTASPASYKHVAAASSRIYPPSISWSSPVDREAMFPVNTPDNRSANPVEAHSAAAHQEALWHTDNKGALARINNWDYTLKP